MKQRGSGVVYSSEHGRMCPHCAHPTKKCICRANPRGDKTQADKGDGIVRIRREAKGRRGKTVTTIDGVPLPSAEIKDLAAELKRLRGTGGSTKDGVIEIQGDHREKLTEELISRGYKVKQAGG